MTAETSKIKRLFLRPAQKEELTGWLFALPWIIGFLLFTFGPMMYSLITSFSNYNIIKPPEWIGFENYETMFTKDPLFYKSLYNTFWMVIIKTPLVLLASISIALLLNIKMPGEKFFRGIIYLPNVLSGVAAIFLWQWILSPKGLFNTFLDLIGIKGPSWFVDPVWTKPGMVVMGMWWIGSGVIIYLAGLKGIPQELYEAASIDGAEGWTKIWNITLPLLSPTIFFQVVTSIIGAFQIFTTALILSGTDSALGGPGQSMLFYVLYLYNRAFGRVGVGGLQMGYASALAWVLFAIILIITAIQLWFSKRWVYYESGE
ncbi:MAG: spermidine/putrescine ABC transporter permease [Anaerolineaceae bacterium]|jgi:multiple sugar transport system permease protein|nr:spermidine/putrescine ABC transporter permease [Anaerolineaceae bacterium]